MPNHRLSDAGLGDARSVTGCLYGLLAVPETSDPAIEGLDVAQKLVWFRHGTSS